MDKREKKQSLLFKDYIGQINYFNLISLNKTHICMCLVFCFVFELNQLLLKHLPKLKYYAWTNMFYWDMLIGTPPPTQPKPAAPESSACPL